jgi:hypothetical protein
VPLSVRSPSVVNIKPKVVSSGVVLDYARGDTDNKKYVYQKSVTKDYQIKLNMSVSEFYNHRPVIQNKN